MATLKEKRTCGQRCEDFGRFIWNSDEGTFMGRTPTKWHSNLSNKTKELYKDVRDRITDLHKAGMVFIIMYYVAFFAVITGLFALSIYVLMYTLDPYTPDYQDRLQSPGVMVWPDTFNDEALEISYNMTDKKSWMTMTRSLEDLLEPYNDTKQMEMNNYTCTAGEYFVQKHFEAPEHTKWSCPFYRSMLGNCSGIDDPTFGYTTAQPCVIIKMNRIINFLPNQGTGSAPYVNCTVLKGEENVRGYTYYPHNATLDLSYYPYYGRLAQPHYANPLVAVKFDLVSEKHAEIQCRVVAHNVDYQNFYDPYEGRVTFLLKALS